MGLLGKTCRGLAQSLLPKEKQQFLLESTPGIAVISPSSPPPWEAQMLCWLASGDNEALGRDMPRASTITLTWGKQTIPARI